VSYTLSKTTSNANSVIFGNTPTNPLDLSEDQGPDTLDRRHNLVINGSALLPYDVQFAGIGTFRSALPYSATTPLQLDADPFSDRPEPRNSRRGDSESSVDLRISKIFRIRNTTVTGFWEIFNVFNTTNFAYDGIAATLPNALPGSGESATQANRVQPGQPYTAANAGTFGRATSTVGRTVGLGTNRQVQFAVRVGF
jgi:hypothetical protein